MRVGIKSGIFAGLVPLVMLMSSGADAAACKPADVAGVWLVEFSFGTTCAIKVNSKGKFSKAPCATSEGVQSKASGQLALSKSCQMSGLYKIAWDDGLTLDLRVQGKLNVKKKKVSGDATSSRDGWKFVAYGTK